MDMNFYPPPFLAIYRNIIRPYIILTTPQASTPLISKSCVHQIPVWIYLPLCSAFTIIIRLKTSLTKHQ